MAYIIENNYIGDGVTTLYSFTFPYLNITDIKASIDGTNTTEYTLANETTLQFINAPPLDSLIKIYRHTEADDLAATFYPGSAIRAQDLNENFTQNLYSTQEIQVGLDHLEAAPHNLQAVTDEGNVTTNGAFFGGQVIVAHPTINEAAATKAYVDGSTGVVPTLQQVTDAGNMTTNGASFGGEVIVAPPVQALAAATKQYVDDNSGGGGSIGTLQQVTDQGNVTTNGAIFGGQVTIPITPLVGTDAASKSYVDNNGGGGVGTLQQVTDLGSTTTNQITIPITPVNPQDAASKAYVDANSGGSVDANAGPGSVGTLQQVTTNGNTTSHSILINTKIELNADGTSNFEGAGTFFAPLQVTGKLTVNGGYDLEVLSPLPDTP